MDKKAQTTKKAVTKKTGYVKKNQNNDSYNRWDSGLGVRPISDLKPIKRGK